MRLKVKSSPWRKSGCHRAFDGDEGNIFGIQTVEADAEALELMNVKDCLAYVGLVMDTVTGSYLLTAEDVIVPDDLFWRCVSVTSDSTQANVGSLIERCERYYVNPSSGRALYSLVFPEDFFYQKGEVVIKEGILIKGRIKKSHIGAYVSRSIIRIIEKEYGNTRAATFIDDATFLVTEWLNERGFTIGIGDCIHPDYEEKAKKRDELFERMKVQIEALGPKRDNPLEEEEREAMSMAIQSAFRQDSIKINRGEMGNLSDMIGGEAKGGEQNISQMTVGLGVNTMYGRRLIPKLSGGQRLMPHFEMGSEDVESRGFIKQSFFEGLSPSSFFFHHMSGREGLNDTAVNTSVSGSLHHNLAKAMENIKIANDGSVRTISGLLLQEVYGNDGFNADTLVTVEGEGGVTYPDFIDLDTVIMKINSKYGWVKEDKKPIYSGPHNFRDLSNTELYRISTGQDRSLHIEAVRELASRDDIDAIKLIVNNPEVYRHAEEQATDDDLLSKKNSRDAYNRMIDRYRDRLGEIFMKKYREAYLLYNSKRGNYISKFKDLASRGHVQSMMVMIRDPEHFGLTFDQKELYKDEVKKIVKKLDEVFTVERQLFENNEETVESRKRFDEVKKRYDQERERYMQLLQ